MQQAINLKSYSKQEASHIEQKMHILAGGRSQKSGSDMDAKALYEEAVKWFNASHMKKETQPKTDTNG